MYLFLYNLLMRIDKIKVTKNDILLLIVIIVIVVAYAMLKVFTIKSESILLNYAENKSKELSLLLIIDSIEKLRSKYNIEDIIVIEKNVNDEIVSLDFDNTKINEFNLKVSENIQKRLMKLEKNKENNLTEKYDWLSFIGTYEGKVDIIYNVPMSIIYDVPVLVGIGPKVPFKLDVLGSVFTEILTNIKDYGINNSLIEMQLKIKINVQIILPFSSKNIIVENKIPLKTKIIQGKIPEYYGGVLNGTIKNE